MTELVGTEAVRVALATGDERKAELDPYRSYACPWCGGLVVSPEGWAANEAANAAYYAKQGEDLIDESLQRDNRGPQPALQSAITVLRPVIENGARADTPEMDWAILGRKLYDALGFVARERLDLHGNAAYGEALRMVVQAGHLVTVEDRRAAMARSDSVAEGNRMLGEMAHRDRLAGLADEVRAKARHEKLGHHVRRGVLLAAEWLAAPAARLGSADERQEPTS